MQRFSFLVAMALLLLTSSNASADAWWGKGARPTEWVLKHGGTIIRYRIEDASGEKDDYKAVMYDRNGDYVEKEFGTKALFDDAKNDVYTIKAYRGGTGQPRTHKGGKKFAEITVTAHPGETINLTFNYKKKSVKMTTDYVKSAPKKIVQSAPITVSGPAQMEQLPIINPTPRKPVSTQVVPEEGTIVDASATADSNNEVQPQDGQVLGSQNAKNPLTKIFNNIDKLFSVKFWIDLAD